MKRISVLLIFIALMILPCFIQSAGTQLWAWQSKWDRVDHWARTMVGVSSVERLFYKDSIISVLYSEEPGYPIYYVNKNATGNGSGTSWQNAFTSIQPAINAAAQSEGWVWVAEGTYQESTWITQEKSGSIYLYSGAMVFGGFAGTEQHLAERDPDQHPTIVKGFVGTGGGGLRAVFMEHKTLLDGFEVTGSGYKRSQSSEWGGRLSQEIAGGGIRTGSWLAVIRNNRVYENHAKGGGGIGCYNRAPVYPLYVSGYAAIVDRNYIYHNHAVCGAGVQLRNDETLFCHNVVYNNTHIPLPGDQTKHKGMEIVIDPSVSDKPIIINSIVWGHPWRNIYDYPYAPRNGGSRKLYDCIQVPYDGYCEGVVESDPLFVDPNNEDFTLSQNSPCIDAGHPDSPLDPDGTRADIGIYNLRYRLTIDDGGAGVPTIGGGAYFPGTEVTISVEPVIEDQAGTSRYTFVRWEGTGDGSYTGTSATASVLMSEDITETIVWEKEFWLEVNSETDQDLQSDWYSEGTQIALEVPSELTVGTGEKRQFLSWAGEGEGSVSGDNTGITVTMNGPVVQTVNWDTEYLLSIDSEHGSPQGEGWYSAGSQAQVNLTTPVSGGQGIQYVFQSWTGEGTGAYNGGNASFAVTMNNPVTETAEWKTQYYLDIVSERGSPTGENWYDANSTAVVTIDTVEAVSTESRYHFQGWQGQGSGSYTGSNPNPSFVMLGPVTQTAVWNLEHWLDVNIDPSNGGTVSPELTGGGWCIHNSLLNLEAIGNGDEGYGFTGWAGDTTAYTNPLVFAVKRPMDLVAHFEKGDVIVQTDPSNLRFIADGDTFTAPRTFFWQSGEKHQLSLIAMQNSASQVRHLFNKWLDYNGNQRQVTIPSDPVTYTALFNTEYNLDIQSSYGLESAQGEGWYSMGDTAYVQIDSLVQISSVSRQRFTGWNGTGNGSVSCTGCDVSVIMQGPVTETAQWTPQYQLKVSCSPSYGGSVNKTPSDSWLDQNTMVVLTATERDTNFTFEGWSGDLTGSTNPSNVEMVSPKDVIANFSTSTVFPPQVASFPDTTFYEDIALIFPYNKLSQYVHDVNDPLDSLDFSLINSSEFSLEKDNINRLIRLIPASNWSGSETLILEATDSWTLSDTDTFMVTVLPVPDPPGPFHLLSPEDETILTDSDQFIKFNWSCSENVDEGDQITYEFYFGQDSLLNGSGTQHIALGTDTTLTMHKNQISGTVFWGVNAKDKDGYTVMSDIWSISAASAVEKNANPVRFELAQNYPNPFNGETLIKFGLPKPGYVEVTICDIRGRVVRQLIRAEMKAGRHSVVWHGEDDSGLCCPSGPYFYQIQYNSSRLQNKMLYIR